MLVVLRVTLCTSRYNDFNTNACALCVFEMCGFRVISSLFVCPDCGMVGNGHDFAHFHTKCNCSYALPCLAFEILAHDYLNAFQRRFNDAWLFSLFIRSVWWCCCTERIVSAKDVFCVWLCPMRYTITYMVYDYIYYIYLCSSERR